MGALIMGAPIMGAPIIDDYRKWSLSESRPDKAQI